MYRKIDRLGDSAKESVETRLLNCLTNTPKSVTQLRDETRANGRVVKFLLARLFADGKIKRYEGRLGNVTYSL